MSENRLSETPSPWKQAILPGIIIGFLMGLVPVVSSFLGPVEPNNRGAIVLWIVSTFAFIILFVAPGRKALRVNWALYYAKGRNAMLITYIVVSLIGLASCL